MTALPCPFEDAEFPTVGQLLQHVAEHLSAGVAPDSPAAKLAATWASSPAARTSAGRSQEILMRLLAASLSNRGVIQTVDSGALKAAVDARAAREAAAALKDLAATYEEQVAASVEDREALRKEAADLKAELARLSARLQALEPHSTPATPLTPPTQTPPPEGGKPL